MINGTVKHWMSSPVVTVTPEMALSEARQLADEHKIRALPVVQNEALVGIITRRGLLRLDLSPLNAAGWQNGGVALAEEAVGDIMTRGPVTITPGASMAKAARIMLENKFTALPVVEGGCLVGILTNSDLMRCIIAEYPGLKKVIPVQNYMSDEVVTVEEDTTLLEAHRLMGTKRIRSLPVLRAGQLVGLVTRTDLMGSDPSRMASRNNQDLSLQVLTQPVSRCMTRSVLTIAPTAPVTEAAELMLTRKVHCLPVLDAEQKLVGIITESDLFLLVVQKL